MNEQLKVLIDDFRKYSGKMTKSYSPSKLTPLANIGTIILTMMELEEYEEEKAEGLRDEIREELMGAETYYNHYQDTGNPAFKAMAKDELRHADFFIREANSKMLDAKSKSKIQSYQEWHDRLDNRLA